MGERRNVSGTRPNARVRCHRRQTVGALGEQLDSSSNIQFSVDVRQVRSHGRFTDAEGLGDLVGVFPRYTCSRTRRSAGVDQPRFRRPRRSAGGRRLPNQAPLPSRRARDRSSSFPPGCSRPEFIVSSAPGGISTCSWRLGAVTGAVKMAWRRATEKVALCWCPEPVFHLDPGARRHHRLSPPSPGCQHRSNPGQIAPVEFWTG